MNKVLLAISLLLTQLSFAQCPVLPTITATTPSARCSNGSLTITATASAGATVSWYAAATGGVALISAASYTTPSLSVTTTYYAEARLVTDNGTCISASRTPVVATINPLPSLTYPVTSERCGSGTFSLVTTPSVVGSTVTWYDASTGGNTLGTGATFTTPVINASGFIYAGVTSPAGCVWPSRFSLILNINPVPVVTSPTAGNRCGTGTVTLNATQTAGTLSWFTALSGGSVAAAGNNAASPSISTTTTFYVQSSTSKCTSSPRVSVVATVNTLPTVTGTGARKCAPGGTLNLTATPSTGANATWYANFTGGVPLGTGNSFTTPNLTVNNTYYIEVANELCTNPSRTPVAVFIDALPSGATITNASRCDSGSVTLTGNNSTVNNIVKWYDSPTGGTLLGTGTSFVTPVTNVTTTYYNDETNTLGCVSTPRAAGVVTIQAVPSVTSFANVSRCGTGSVVLTATPSSGGTIRWFSSAVGGASLLAGNSFTTPNLGINTTYYAQAQFSNVCFENTRVPITATIKPYPAATYTVSGNIITATETDPGMTYQWQTCTTNPNIVGATSQSYTATSSNSYRLTLTLNGCFGNSSCIPITVVPTDVNDQSIGQGINSFYPNPSNGNFIITSDENASATIMNGVGAKVATLELLKGENEINLNLIGGIYFININKQMLKLMIK